MKRLITVVMAVRLTDRVTFDRDMEEIRFERCRQDKLLPDVMATEVEAQDYNK